MKNPQSFRNSGAYTSPGTPEYGDSNVGGTLKSWQSERVPLPTNGNRSHISAAALMPFNSGRALPSKWDDAERWITSPISGNAACKTSFAQSQRRQKSKSGPQALGYFSNYSPIVPVLECGSVKNYTANSPLSTGVLISDRLHVHYNGGINYLDAGNSVTWSSSVPGLSDLISETSVPSSQGIYGIVLSIRCVTSICNVLLMHLSVAMSYDRYLGLLPINYQFRCSRFLHYSKTRDRFSTLDEYIEPHSSEFVSSG